MQHPAILCIRGNNQISESRGQLERLKRETWDYIQRIQTEAEEAENKRRGVEESKRQERYQKLQDESIQSSIKNGELDQLWQGLLRVEQCEDLNQGIQSVIEQCKNALQQKEQMIQEFKNSLKEADDKYVKALKKQAQDINSLLKFMEQQYKAMCEEYAKQLDRIEEAYKEERNEILQSNKESLDVLFKNHKDNAQQALEQRQKEEEKHDKIIEKIRAEDASSYSDHKIKLETDLQLLEMCMEEMKAVYLLNQEKLEYNYQVLHEKVDENEKYLKDLKQKENRYLQKLRQEQSNYEGSDRKYVNDNRELTDKYKKSTKMLKELQNKFKHFEASDYKRYQEIWDMNEEEVRDLANKVLQADRTVHIQQLGLPWTPPEHLTHSEFVESKVETTQQDPETQQETVKEVFEVFSLIVSECQYLLDDRARESLMGKSNEEQLEIMVEGIKKVLEIDTVEDQELLVKLFYQNENGEEQEMLQANPDQVIEILDKFQTIREERRKDPEAWAQSLRQRRKLGQEMTEKERKEREKREEKQFWEQMQQVLPKAHERLWIGLDTQLQKYYTLLQDRQKLVEETGVLHEQNEELKTLLNQYLQAGVNHELMVPPTQLIHVEEETV